MKPSIDVEILKRDNGVSKLSADNQPYSALQNTNTLLAMSAAKMQKSLFESAECLKLEEFK